MSDNVDLAPQHLLFGPDVRLDEEIGQHGDQHERQHPEERAVILQIADDGIGFDVNEVIHGTDKGMGFSNMISRIRSIKGTIDIESQPDSGMKALIRVKL